MSIMDTRSTDERVATVETQVSALHGDFSELKKQVSHLADVVTRGFARINEGSKTNWAMIFGSMSILLIIIGFIGSGYVRDINRVEEGGKALLEARIQSLGVVSNLQTRVQASEDSIDKLDVTLQREMRLLDSATDAEIEALAERIHKENELTGRANDIQLTEIRRRLGSIEAWQKTHDSRVVGLNAAQWERIKGLEREVFGKAAGVSFGAALGSD